MARVVVSILAVGVLAVAAACTAPGTSANAPSQAPSYAAGLQPKLEQIAKDRLLTGAVVLVRSPELGDWTWQTGTRTYRGNDPVQVGDHVRVGSNTKTWTGTVILQLVGEGRLALDDPVSKYRPDVPNGQNITIAQLLDMRSGLANYTVDFDLNNQMDIYPTKVWKPEELLAKAFAMPPVATPGEKFFYSNTNTVLLGLIIEQLTGHPVAEEFRNRLFAPLGMNNTVMPDLSSTAIPDPHPRGYTYGTNVGTIDSLVLPPDVQAAAKTGEIVPMDVTDVNPSWGWTAGAGISTAEDLARWVEALGGGGLLTPDLQKQRLASVQAISPGDPASAGYGLALARFGHLYGHSGELPGYNSFMGYDPDRKITIVAWATPAPSVDGNGPAVELAKSVIGTLYG
ncbi:serine hydrolase domain-containing protein [Pseudonocardia hispaniensis]|uniref:Serine hydrolase domain-containing protein n=1 Tax=Pseudonocardia hispaniensis TaxID=904933 RepID=A0ABW1J659_9PSEU